MSNPFKVDELVASRVLVDRKITVPATGKRLDIPLKPGENARAFYVTIRNRDTIGVATPVNLFFTLNPDAPEGESVSQLLAGVGDYLLPGVMFSTAIPGEDGISGKRRVILDLAGVQQDFATAAEVTALVRVYELVKP
ncbi:MAG: hypothetical protein OEY28_00110 [Nitrospira sp.]|nr:hypothetical protein [Nitrospira sp.]